MNYSKMTKEELITIVKEKEDAKLNVVELEAQIEKLKRQNEIMRLARKEDETKIHDGEEATEKLKKFIDVHNNNLQELTNNYNDKIQEMTNLYDDVINKMKMTINEQNQTIIKLFDMLDMSRDMQEKYYTVFKSMIIIEKNTDNNSKES